MVKEGFNLLLNALEDIGASGKSISIEVIPAEKEVEVKQPEITVDLENLDSYKECMKEMTIKKITSPSFKKANVENKILALDMYNMFKGVDATTVNSKALHSAMDKIMDINIDRKDIKQRLAIVSENVPAIACALDAHNPEIIDSMIRTKELEEYLKTAKPVDEVTTENLMETYVSVEALLNLALEIDYTK